MVYVALKFKADTVHESYRGHCIECCDGETVVVIESEAAIMLADWPKNFTKVSLPKIDGKPEIVTRG